MKTIRMEDLRKLNAIIGPHIADAAQFQGVQIELLDWAAGVQEGAQVEVGHSGPGLEAITDFARNVAARAIIGAPLTIREAVGPEPQKIIAERREVTEVDRAKIAQLRDEGMSTHDAADLLGLTPPQVRGVFGVLAKAEKRAQDDKAPAQPAASTKAASASGEAKGPAWVLEISARLDALGNTPDFTPGDDLWLVEQLLNGGSSVVVSDEMGVSAGEIGQRFKALMGGATDQADQTRVLTVLKLRHANAICG